MSLSIANLLPFSQDAANNVFFLLLITACFVKVAGGLHVVDQVAVSVFITLDPRALLPPQNTFFSWLPGQNALLVFLLLRWQPHLSFLSQVCLNASPS